MQNKPKVSLNHFKNMLSSFNKGLDLSGNINKKLINNFSRNLFTKSKKHSIIEEEFINTAEYPEYLKIPIYKELKRKVSYSFENKDYKRTIENAEYLVFRYFIKVGNKKVLIKRRRFKI